MGLTSNHNENSNVHFYGVREFQHSVWTAMTTHKEESKTAGNSIGSLFRLIVCFTSPFSTQKNWLPIVFRWWMILTRISSMEERRKKITCIQRFTLILPNRFQTREWMKRFYFTLRGELTSQAIRSPSVPNTFVLNIIAIHRISFIKKESNMLLVDKQRPKSLSEMDYHKDISQNLIKMVIAENPTMSE